MKGYQGKRQENNITTPETSVRNADKTTIDTPADFNR
jgi:hypothetical protein